MKQKTKDGYTILLPNMGIEALVVASRPEFVQEILAKNPALPAAQLTRQNLLCCFLGLAAQLGKHGPFSARIKAQIRNAQQLVGTNSSDQCLR